MGEDGKFAVTPPGLNCCGGLGIPRFHRGLIAAVPTGTQAMVRSGTKIRQGR